MTMISSSLRSLASCRDTSQLLMSQCLIDTIMNGLNHTSEYPLIDGPLAHDGLCLCSLGNQVIQTGPDGQLLLFPPLDGNNNNTLPLILMLLALLTLMIGGGLGLVVVVVVALVISSCW